MFKRGTCEIFTSYINRCSCKKADFYDKTEQVALNKMQLKIK